MSRVLSIDGCGFRGLTPLLVLQRLMQDVGGARGEALPCKVFDLICGTGTGGLIAILLGRLGLSCTDAVAAYETLEAKIFGNIPADSVLSTLLNSNGFSTDAFEAELKRLVAQHTGNGDALLFPPSTTTETNQDNRTRTFVTMMSSVTTSDVDAHRIRSYLKPPKSTDVDPIGGHPWSIRDAARGTTSCPRLFPPITVATTGFQAANTSGFSNPSMIAYLEALDLFGNDGEITLVSVGMGVRSHVDPAMQLDTVADPTSLSDTSTIDGVIQSLRIDNLSATADKRLRELIRQSQLVATGTEVKNLRVSDRMRRAGIRHRYHRLNPTGDSRSIVFVDYGQRPLIDDIRNNWLRGDGKREMKKTVAALISSVGQWVAIRGQTCEGHTVKIFDDIDDDLTPDDKAAEIKAKCYQWEADHPDQIIRCFTTEGIAKEKVSHIHSAPMDLYVRVLIDGSFTFYQGENRQGGTFDVAGFSLDSDTTDFDIVQALNDAKSNPSILAFNSKGHAKNQLGDRVWTPQHSMPHQGVWVRNT